MFVYVFEYQTIQWNGCFPGVSDRKESGWNMGDLGSVPGVIRSPRERNGSPLQYSCLENSMDRGAWQVIVHGITVGHDWVTHTHNGIAIYNLFS